MDKKVDFEVAYWGVAELLVLLNKWVLKVIDKTKFISNSVLRQSVPSTFAVSVLNAK